MFKVGDIVYCIDIIKHTNTREVGYIYPILYLDKPYMIHKIVNNFIVLLDKDVQGIQFFNYRFISEKEYQKSKRFEKLNKIKECINLVT